MQPSDGAATILPYPMPGHDGPIAYGPGIADSGVAGGQSAGAPLFGRRGAPTIQSMQTMQAQSASASPGGAANARARSLPGMILRGQRR